jgi:hypothetical protein
MTRSREAGISVAVIAVYLALATFSAFAQETEVVEDWRATRAQTTGVMLDLDSANNVFEVGETIDSVVTRKFDSEGTLLWERIAEADRARASWISTDPGGNAIVAAYLVTGGSFSPAGWLVVKYDPLGDVLWQNTIPVAEGRTVRIETDDAGNAYVTGTMFLGTTVDAVTTKYAPDGGALWTKTFNGGTAVADVASSVAVSPDGTRIATVGRSGTSFFTVIYDAQGNVIRQNVRSKLGTAFDAAFGPNKELYVGTSQYNQQTGDDQMTIVKFSESGGTVWTRSYSVGDYIYRIAVDLKGRAVAVGVLNTGWFDWVTLKVRPNGNALWSQGYSATNGDDEIPAFVSIDTANAIYVTGRAGPIPPGCCALLMMTTIKYAPNGTFVWVVNQDINRAVSVRVGTDEAVYVLGQGEMLTVRYLQST